MRRSNIQLLAFALVAVAGVYTILSRPSKSPERSAPAPADLFFPGLEVPRVDRIEVASPDGRIALARAGADWVVEGAPHVLADTAKVAGALREAAALSRTDVASVVPGKDAPFGLSGGTRVALRAGGAPVAEFDFGARGPGGVGTYARPAGAENVYLVPSTLASVFPLDPSLWRDRRPYRFPIERTRTLSIEHAGERVDLAVLDDGRWHMLRPRELPADTRKVERALVLLAALSAKDFADDGTPAECGLAGAPGAATSVVTVGLADGRSVRALFGRSEGGLRFAMADGRTTIYAVSAEMVGEILQGGSAFLP